MPRPSTLLEGAGEVWDAISKKGLIAERVLAPNQLCGNMLAQIRGLHWEKLCNIETPASPKLVREFYANLSVTEGNFVKVRNVVVNISAPALNDYLGIPEPENDDYADMCLYPQWEEWIRILSHPGATYKTKVVHGQVVPSHLPISSLNRYAKAWQHFICATILPNLREHTVDLQRLALLVCIVTGRGVNIGKILKERFMFCANRDTDVTLGNVGLITQLYLNEGLRIPASETREKLGDPIDDRKIMSLKQWKHGAAHPDGRGFIDIPEQYQGNPDAPFLDAPDDVPPPAPLRRSRALAARGTRRRARPRP